MTGLEILLKLIGNILKSPGDDQYRLFKRTNKAIQNKVLSLEPSNSVVSLIEALGYVEVDKDFHVFTGDYLKVLAEGNRLISEFVMEIKQKSIDAEKKQKAELMER